MMKKLPARVRSRLHPARKRRVKKVPRRDPSPPHALQSLEKFEERIGRLISLLEEKAGREGPAPELHGDLGMGAGKEDEIARVFSRAVSDAVDGKLEEIISAAASLQASLLAEAETVGMDPDPPAREAVGEILSRAVLELGKILKSMGCGAISPQVGEPYDPLIHLAVGESGEAGAEEGTVARVVRPGYRSGRGRVVIPARVLVGRR